MNTEERSQKKEGRERRNPAREGDDVARIEAATRKTEKIREKERRRENGGRKRCRETYDKNGRSLHFYPLLDLLVAFAIGWLELVGWFWLTI